MSDKCLFHLQKADKCLLQKCLTSILGKERDILVPLSDLSHFFGAPKSFWSFLPAARNQPKPSRPSERLMQHNLTFWWPSVGVSSIDYLYSVRTECTIRSPLVRPWTIIDALHMKSLDRNQKGNAGLAGNRYSGDQYRSQRTESDSIMFWKA